MTKNTKAQAMEINKIPERRPTIQIQWQKRSGWVSITCFNKKKTRVSYASCIGSEKP